MLGKALLKNDKGLGDTIARFTHWFDVRYGAAGAGITSATVLAWLGPWFYGTAIGGSVIGSALAWKFRERLKPKCEQAKEFFENDQNGKFHIAAAVEWFAKKILRLDDCGCAQRQARLNSMFPYRKTTLTIAMPHKHDWEGVWATINFFRDEILAEGLEKWVSINVIDQQPGWGGDIHNGGHLKRLTSQISDSGVKCGYFPFTEVEGSAPAKNAAFRYSSGDWVLVVDCHVQLERGSLKKTFDFIQKNSLSNDLYHGQLCTDDRKAYYVGLKLYHPNPAGWQTPRPMIGKDLVFGVWETKMAKDMPKTPFEIEACGGWCILSRRAAFVGYHPLMAGFGGEEGYTHEATRQRGNKVYSLPFLRGTHRFHRMNTINYGGDEKIIRNHVIGCMSIGKDLQVWREALLATEKMPAEKLDDIVSRTVAELSEKSTIQKMVNSEDPTEKREGLFLESVVNQPWSGFMPSLRQLASMCRSVVEFGTRGSASSIAILVAQPEEFTSYDLKTQCNCKHLTPIAGATKLEYLHGPEWNLRTADIRQCEMFFVNHLPEGDISQILDRQQDKVSKWIVVHGNTTEAAQWAESRSDWPFVDNRPDGLCVIGRESPVAD